MSFGSPELLITLVVLPLAVIGYAALERRRAARSVVWSRSEMLPNIVRRPKHGRYLPLALFLLGLAFLLVGFARPRIALGTTDHFDPTIVLTMDVSGSMAATDVAPTRIAAAHSLAIAFLHALPAGYRVAVVSFGNVVRILVPPTLDRQMAEARVPATITVKAGTSLGDGLAAAVAAISETTANEDAAAGYPGAILLLSDGAQTAGGTSPDDASATASIARVPIDTVTIGTSEGTVSQPVSVDGFTSKLTLRVPSSPATMEYLAVQTGGTEYPLASTAQVGPLAQKLATSFTRLNVFSVPARHTHDLSPVAGGAALVAILGAMGVSLRWFGRFA